MPKSESIKEKSTWNCQLDSNVWKSWISTKTIIAAITVATAYKNNWYIEERDEWT
jgi:hypothetical protein